MAKVLCVPGIQWAADILSGQRPIPKRKEDDDEDYEGFKEILDSEMAKLERGRG